MSEQVQALPIEEPMELFDESMLPVREDLVEMVRERSFLPVKRPDSARFSGKIVIKRMMNDVEMCEAVCSALLIGLSVRLIGKRFGLSTRSVVNIRDAMSDRGELAAVGKRLSAKLDQFAELGLERMIEGILDGTIHPGQLPIPVLAALDKRAQFAAGVVPGTGRTEAAITLEMVLAEYAAARAALDLRSDARLAQAVAPQSIGAPEGNRESQVEAGEQGRKPAGELLLEMPNAGPVVPPAATPDSKTGAGGVGVSAARPVSRGDGPENFTP